MARVSQEILDNLLNDFRSEPHEYVVSKWITERVPVLFDGDEDLFRRTKLKIADLLGVDSCSIIFVGSSCTGFSLNPNKDCKVFDDSSDIDIAVISHWHFTEAWHWLKVQNNTLLKGKTKKAYNSHRSHYIFDGTIATDQILLYLPFGKEWRAAIQELEKDPVFRGLDIHFRLYQDHKSLIDYHISNIRNNLSILLGVQPEDKLLTNE